MSQQEKIRGERAREIRTRGEWRGDAKGHTLKISVAFHPLKRGALCIRIDFSSMAERMQTRH